MGPNGFHHALLKAYLTPIQEPESITVSLSYWDGFKDYWCVQRGVEVKQLEDGSIESPFEQGKLLFVPWLPPDVVIVPGLGAPLEKFFDSPRETVTAAV